jgi:type III pantothenate kinase
MKLLVDLGNSRLKWALWDGGSLRPGTPLDHSAELEPQLLSAWREVCPVDAVLVASVARGELEEALRRAIATRFQIAPQFVRSGAQAHGVVSAYAMPEKLGIDRFLALLALHAQKAQATVLASVGTALTLDALGADGRHLGGLIAPSPALMQKALLGATSRVTVSDASQLLEIAGDTEDAVRSGCWLAAVALIERFHAHAATELGVTPSLVLAGGAGDVLASRLSMPARYEPDLVLRGLGLYAGT